jgi:hypothetical protein
VIKNYAATLKLNTLKSSKATSLCLMQAEAGLAIRRGEINFGELIPLVWRLGDFREILRIDLDRIVYIVW